MLKEFTCKIRAIDRVNGIIVIDDEYSLQEFEKEYNKLSGVANAIELPLSHRWWHCFYKNNGHPLGCRVEKGLDCWGPSGCEVGSSTAKITIVDDMVVMKETDYCEFIKFAIEKRKEVKEIVEWKGSLEKETE